MSILAALYSRLAAVSGVTDLVSTRIYPDRAPQDAALPYLTLHRISTPHEHHLGGATGLARPRVQVSAWASRSDTAESVAEAVRTALQGWTGTSASVAIRQCHLDAQRGGYKPPADGGDAGAHVVYSDYLIWHTESVPTF